MTAWSDWIVFKVSQGAIIDGEIETVALKGSLSTVPLGAIHQAGKSGAKPDGIKLKFRLVHILVQTISLRYRDDVLKTKYSTKHFIKLVPFKNEQ